MLIVKIGTCGQCLHRNSDGLCTNKAKIHEDKEWWLLKDEHHKKNKDHLVYSYEELGDFWVGPLFGCIHWKFKGCKDD